MTDKIDLDKPHVTVSRSRINGKHQVVYPRGSLLRVEGDFADQHEALAFAETVAHDAGDIPIRILD